MSDTTTSKCALLERAERRQPAFREADLPVHVELEQRALDRLQHTRLVIDEQHPHGVASVCEPSLASTSGRQMTNVVPRLTSVSKAIEP